MVIILFYNLHTHCMYLALSLFYVAFSLESQTKYYMDVQNQDITKLAR